MSNYNIAELEEIIERGEAKIEELVEEKDEMPWGSSARALLDEVIGRLEDRIEELKAELEEINEEMAQGYEADCAEALDLYVEQGGELNDDGEPVDEDMYRDVFFEMQMERVENGI
ncbi:hypothetical protein [Ralstonia insidiosa]|uniref:Coiled-coil domain-containing protein 22 n=1 Tax=Ralstonia insidiosa TaxID=190721 RepID=A0A848NY79_9RALS|nr:hypothetical protein [Ralstonia insidiosa]NMV38269.1 coiled-coil domain-containing protein 22 [Ralstonia insidiosa]